MNIKVIKTAEFKKELRGKNIEKNHPNVKRVLRSLSEQDMYLAHFENEETVVMTGCITDTISSQYNELDYAEVPLGIITRGKIVIFKNGKAVRHLTPGDFIGLFETAHFLYFNSKKILGNWTLLADGETKIAFFGRESFDHSRIASKKTLEHYLIQLAREDRTPKPLTELPLLDQFANSVDVGLQGDVLVIAHTHILESSYPLFRHLAAIVGYQNIFLIEKPYSTTPRMADKVVEMGAELIRVAMRKGLAYEFAIQDSIRILWSKVIPHAKKMAISRIIIIDDGADVIANVPWSDLRGITIVGIEQTTRGIARLNDGCGVFPPVISVAGSALKKEIESDFIAEAIVTEVKNIFSDIHKKKIGVVGMGNIGKRIIDELEKINTAVTYYDFSKFNSMGSSRKGNITSASELIEKNDIIIGATGKDFLKGVVLDKAKGEKYLVSASSADVEFYSMLNRAGFPGENFETISFQSHQGLTLKILNGGYPINFNRKKEIEKAEDMQLTRTLLFAGFVEALNMPKKEKKTTIYKLNTELQREILNIWIAVKPKSSDARAISTRQIEKLSEGEILKRK
jgi:S-adenosylhomocysteine hydrolase